MLGKKIYQYILVALLFWGGLSSCNPVQETLQKLPMTPATISGEANKIPTKVIDPLLIPDPLPTITTAPSESPIIVTDTEKSEDVDLEEQKHPPMTPALVTQKPTIVLQPTLSPVQAGELLSSLMNGNNECELPCWWGITPGKVNEQEAKDLFATYGIGEWTHSDDYRIVGIGYPRTDSSNYFRDVIVRFWVNRDFIDYIGVEGSYRRELNSNLIQDWQTFSPSEILERYKLPSYIEFMKVKNSPYYRLVLSYGLLGIEISYMIPFEPVNNGTEKVCFDLENVDFIYLSLYSPERVNNIPVGIIPNRLDSYISWEKTTGSELEDIQNIFEATPHCIEVLAN